MNIQVCSPLEAKRLFKFRPYRHLAYGVAVFTPISAGLMFFINPLLAVVIALIPAVCLCYYLETRLVVIECLTCGKDINTNTPWQCGFKGCRNENVDKFPFIHECEHCHYVPKAYVCHHGDHFIFLTTDRQKDHAAKRLDSPPPTPIDAVKVKMAHQAEKIQDAKYELMMAKYAKETEIVKNKPSTPPPVTPEAQKRLERIRRDIENGKAIVELKQQHLREIHEIYKNDTGMLSDMERVVLDAIWKEEQRRQKNDDNSSL